MTRSVGDRYGPRCCVALPDVTALTIHANEFARFIIASDGMWDVVTVETVNEIAESISDPHRLARRLATAAYNQRLNEHIRLDDITVIVVDVNYSLRAPATGGGCGCSVV